MKRLIKVISYIFVLIFITANYLYAQDSCWNVAIVKKGIVKDTVWRKRNIIWLTPVGYNTEINGLALGGIASGVHSDSLIVNGLNIEIGIGLFFFPYLFLNPNVETFESDSIDHSFNEHLIKLNGVSISLMGHCANSKINGISLNSIAAMHSQCDGVLATIGGSLVGNFSGLMIAGIRNYADAGKGLQISVFNSCSKLKGFQIGLINKNQKRTLPFINWCFTD